MKTKGIHHITAIVGDPQENVDFYAGFLGMRLVKKTINFDDPGTYHLYFGDDNGSPGTIMTFFPWPGAHKGASGGGKSVERTLRFHRERWIFGRSDLRNLTSRMKKQLASGKHTFNLKIHMDFSSRLWNKNQVETVSGRLTA